MDGPLTSRYLEYIVLGVKDSGVSPKINLKKSSWALRVPFARYKSRMFLTRFLLDTPEARVFGMTW